MTLSGPPPQDPNAYDGNGVQAFLIAGLIIVFVALALRLWSRKMRGIAFKADDWTLVASFVLTVGSTIGYLEMCVHGAGHHWSTLGIDNQIAFLKAEYAFNITYTIAYPLSRISLVLLYRRIFVQQWYHYFTDVMVALYIMYMIATVVIDSCLNLPVSSSWNQVKGPEYAPMHSVDLVHLFIANGVFNIVTDIALLAVALIIIWRLRMSPRTKAGLTFVFCLGTLTLVASIIRMVYFFQVTQEDESWTLLPLVWWTAAEQYLGVLCPCLITLGPLIAVFYDLCSQGLSSIGVQAPDLGTSRRRTAAAAPGAESSANTREIAAAGMANETGLTTLDEKDGEMLNERKESQSTDVETGRGWMDEKHVEGMPITQPVTTESSDDTLTNERREMVEASHSTRVSQPELHNRLARDEHGMAIDQDLAVASLDPTALQR